MKEKNKTTQTTYVQQNDADEETNPQEVKSRHLTLKRETESSRPHSWISFFIPIFPSLLSFHFFSPWQRRPASVFRAGCPGPHPRPPPAERRSWRPAAAAPSCWSWGGAVWRGRGAAGRWGSWPASGDSSRSAASGWSRSPSPRCPRSTAQGGGGGLGGSGGGKGR